MRDETVDQQQRTVQGTARAHAPACWRVGYVERSELPWPRHAVGPARRDLYVDVIGAQALGGAPMQRDTIFRISSMTKPVTAVAAMILWWKSASCGSTSRWTNLLPELAGRRVLKRLDGPLDQTAPAKTADHTVRDLLTFRMGFGQMIAAPGAYPILKAAGELSKLALGPPKSHQRCHAPDE